MIDSSILYAAVISRKGHAHDLIRLAIAGRVQPVTSGMSWLKSPRISQTNNLGSSAQGHRRERRRGAPDSPKNTGVRLNRVVINLDH